MTDWHVDDEALRRWVDQTDSMADGASVEQHLLACATCRSRANRESQVLDLDAVWARTREAIEAPPVGVFERALRGLGLAAPEARLVAVSRAFRSGWVGAVAATLVFATLAAAFGHTRGLWLFLAVAPIVPCVAVAFSYDARVDPALEPELVTPYSAVRLILLRSVTVLAVALPAVILFGWLIPGIEPFAWLLPGLGFTTVVLAASTWTTSLRAATVVSLLWLGLVSVLAAGPYSPDSMLRSEWQTGFFVLAALSCVMFMVRRHHLRELRPWR
jgi:hypothetical protein